MFNDNISNGSNEIKHKQGRSDNFRNTILFSSNGYKLVRAILTFSSYLGLIE